MKLLTRLLLVSVFSVAVPFASAQDKAEDIYKAKCAKCHGADGKATAVGTKLGTRDFSDPEVAKMPDSEWIEVTTKGRKKMPAYGKSLKDEQIKMLVAYIRDLTKKAK
jgi:cytochrome c6